MRLVSRAWEAKVLPLNYTRRPFHSTRDAGGGANHVGSNEEERLDAGRRRGLDVRYRNRSGAISPRGGRGDVRGRV